MRYRIFRSNTGRSIVTPQEINFRWLDEAITERLSRILRGPKKEYYEKEQEFFDTLLKKGVPLKLFYKAYFENYEPQDEVRIPAWKGLSTQLQRALKDQGGLKILASYAEAAEKLHQKGEPEL